MVICPQCNNENPDDAAFCGFCGANMVATPAPEAAKTVYGYQVDEEKLAEAGAILQPVPEEPVAEPAVEPEPEPALEAAAEPEPAAVEEPDPVPAEAPGDMDETIPVGAMMADTMAATLSAGSEPVENIAGKYQLGAVMEELPVGRVFQATDEGSGDEVALLLVRKTVFPSPLDMERARRELHQLVKVDCPNIVKVLDYGKTDAGQFYVVTEPTRVTPLDVLVATGGPMEMSDAQYLIKSIGSGLAEAQKIGVIHRDIGPHNVVVDREGTVKIRGFGVAPCLKAKVFGTAEYVSPEQAQGRPVDQRSNIYSLGAVMFYVLTGEPPFSDPDLESLLTKHQKEPPKSPKSRRQDLELSNKGEALVLKALAKSSSRRHLTLRQFLREVEGLKLDVAATAGQDSLTLRFDQAEGQATVQAATVGDTIRDIPNDSAAADQNVDPIAKTMMNMPPVQPPAEPAPEPAMADTMPEPDPPAAVAELLEQEAAVAQAEAEAEAAEAEAEAAEAEAVAAEAEAEAAIKAAEAEAEAAEAEAEAAALAAMEAEEAAKEAEEAAAAQDASKAAEANAVAAMVAKEEAAKQGEGARGVLNSETTLKKPEPSEAKPKKKLDLSAPVPQQRKGFRETMWFVKGEEESEDASLPEDEKKKKEEEEEKKSTLAALAGEETPEDLAQKYTDDGSIGAEGSHHLSLRTGKTQQMKAVQLPTNEVPGERMDEKEFLDEMNRGRTYMIWIGVGVAIAAVVGIIIAVL